MNPLVLDSPEYLVTEDRAAGQVRTVLGDLSVIPPGVFYPHEHLIIDSPLIASAFPHILLDDVAAAEKELAECAPFGIAAIVDAMPASAGRDVVRLALISRRTNVPVIATTGFHHDRYYGPKHWTNHLSVDQLADLLVADLTEGIDEFDYTSPVIRRTTHRAGIIKVATSGAELDARDRRNLEAVGQASARTGSPILTHCEGGLGAMAQLEFLAGMGVPAGSILLGHPDKADDLGYLLELVAAGAVLELDQALRQRELGSGAPSVRAVVALVERGFEDHIVVAGDAARRTLWHALGGEPGLVWLGATLPVLLREAGLTDEHVAKISRSNAIRAFTWRPVT